MLHAVHIDRYRGIARCVAEGFGRVNLVVGKNDSGKTSFLEAIELADEAENAGHILLFWQLHRLARTTQAHDLERFWRPLFFGLDARTGFSVSVTRDDGARQAVDVRQGAGADPVVRVAHDDDVRLDLDDTRVDQWAARPSAAVERERRLLPTLGGSTITGRGGDRPGPATGNDNAWIRTAFSPADFRHMTGAPTARHATPRRRAPARRATSSPG
jgi:hypothetical protein